MKRYLLVVALAAMPACGKQNDAQILQHEAETLAKYYQPRLDAIDARIQNIMNRGKDIPGSAPGVRELGLRLQEARDTAVRLRGLVGATGQDSAIKKDAEAAAKANEIGKLEQLVHDAEVALEKGVTVINANLTTIESWISQYDSKTLAMAVTPAAPESPAVPEAQTPATGQPPAAAQPGAQPAADQKQPAADAKQPAADAKQPAAAAKQPAADAKQPAPAQPKAAQPKAAPQPKPAQPAPAPAQPKAAQPAPAQPKAPTPAPAAQNK